MLNRASIDVARLVQAASVVVALFVDFGEWDGTEEAAVVTLVTFGIEFLKRRSVTPVADPRAEDGSPLVPSVG